MGPSTASSRPCASTTDSIEPDPPGATSSGRIALPSAIRIGAAACVALLAVGVYLGSQRHRNAALEAPAVPSASTSNEGTVAPVAADTRHPPTATGVEGATAPVRPVRPPASSAIVRPKPRTQAAVAAGAVLPAVPPPVPAPGAALDAAPPPRIVAEPAPPVAAEPAWTDPHEACSKQGFIGRALCINERCSHAAFAGSPECVKLRKAAEQAEQAQWRGG
jgi:hypothetical protein